MTETHNVPVKCIGAIGPLFLTSGPIETRIERDSSGTIEMMWRSGKRVANSPTVTNCRSAVRDELVLHKIATVVQYFSVREPAAALSILVL